MIQKTNYRVHPVQQLLMLVLLCAGLTMVGLLLGVGLVLLIYGQDVLMQSLNIADASAPGVLNSLKILQMFSSAFMFLLPALLFTRIVVKQNSTYLHHNFRFAPALVLLVFLIMFSMSPIMELLINLNTEMVFPNFLKGLEVWMREMEKTTAEATKVLLKMDTLSDLWINLLMVAVLPALAEEFFFRGCVQNIFTQWARSPHWGIWIAAAIFSAIHLQFLGFLPRMVLGALFGYLLYWSGSIWPAVLAHFINNATAVLVTYFYQQKKIGIDPNDQHVFNQTGYVISIIATVALLFLFRNMALKHGEKQLSNL